jgi:hypothetical protein
VVSCQAKSRRRAVGTHAGVRSVCWHAALNPIAWGLPPVSCHAVSVCRHFFTARSGRDDDPHGNRSQNLFANARRAVGLARLRAVGPLAVRFLTRDIAFRPNGLILLFIRFDSQHLPFGKAICIRWWLISSHNANGSALSRMDFRWTAAKIQARGNSLETHACKISKGTFIPPYHSI